MTSHELARKLLAGADLPIFMLDFTAAPADALVEPKIKVVHGVVAKKKRHFVEVFASERSSVCKK